MKSLDSVDALKKELLLFDKILIVGLKEYNDVFQKNEITSQNELLENRDSFALNDLIILNSYVGMYNLVNSPSGCPGYKPKFTTEESTFFNQNFDFLLEKGKIIIDYNEISDKNKQSEANENITPSLERKLNADLSYDVLFNMCLDLKARIIAASCDNSKFTAIPYETSIYSIDEITNTKADVYSLLLEDFPIIETDQIAWEQIFDFKSDPDVYNAIWSLRNWISSISRTNRQPNEIEEEYRDLKYQYEKAINLHKLKNSSNAFQTTIQTSAELVENLAKLNFKKATDVFFQFRKQKIALMEVELKSKGNQLSYLYKLKTKFN
ncbi:hypothetical protein [Winogradskyella sp.]|uniref:hypothetical protein n=1 Tax=Winogradskyella sp. TaxID=1883156 RepID=UPI0025D03E46|nr:hypothetical protein [Winogradskyella sp.]